MNKAERLMQLLNILRSRRRAVTARQLAERLEVSERTIYRDIQSLQATGVTIEGEAGVGYIIHQDATLAPLMFTESETEALVIATRLIKAWGDDAMIAAADSALTKIRAVLPERMVQQLNQRATPILVPELDRKRKIQFSEQIRQAIHNQHCLELAYEDAKGNTSQRLIEPLGLVFWGMTWTLIGYCRLREDYRMFRLDRIQQLQMTSTSCAASEHSLKSYLQALGEDISTDFWID